MSDPDTQPLYPFSESICTGLSLQAIRHLTPVPAASVLLLPLAQLIFQDLALTSGLNIADTEVMARGRTPFDSWMAGTDPRPRMFDLGGLGGWQRRIAEYAPRTNCIKHHRKPHASTKLGWQDA